MRLFLLLAVTIALAWGVMLLLGDEEGGPATSHVPAPEPEAAPPPHGALRPVPSTVTLVLVVKTDAGYVPPEASGGYRWGGRDRLRPVDASGRVVFTDAPTGPVTLVARAPGHRETQQRRYLTGGIPTEALLLLEPEE